VKENAVHFEAVKIAMTQGKDGLILKLAIHPNDAPQDVILDPVGARYIIAAVRLSDDDQPMVPQRKKAVDSIIAAAGLMCRNERFQNWLMLSGHADKADEDSAVEAIRNICGIKSRAEFATNEEARNNFLQIKREFEQSIKSGDI
jgi:hypothetical protein